MLKNELTKLFFCRTLETNRDFILSRIFCCPHPQKNLKTTLRNWLPVAINVKHSSNVKVLVISDVLLTRVKLSLHKAKKAHTGSGGKFALILILSVMWRCLVSLTHRRLCPLEKSCRYLINRSLSEPQRRMERCIEGNVSCRCRGLNSGSSAPQPR